MTKEERRFHRMRKFIQVTTVADDLLSGTNVEIIGPIDDDDLRDALIVKINSADTDGYRINAATIRAESVGRSQWTAHLVEFAPSIYRLRAKEAAVLDQS